MPGDALLVVPSAEEDAVARKRQAPVEHTGPPRVLYGVLAECFGGCTLGSGCPIHGTEEPPRSAEPSPERPDRHLGEE
jgi:hypothetical protein